jgi:hypothetical protein
MMAQALDLLKCYVVEAYDSGEGAMRLSKLSIRNFRNFQSVDIPLAGNVVLVGQNM